MRIVSFTGPRGSGKDTCADILKAEGVTQGKISFAGPMKAMMCEIYGIPASMFENRDLKEMFFGEKILIGRLTVVKLFERMTDYIEFHPSFKPKDFLNSHHTYAVTTPRELLQFIGTEIIRNHIDPDWHVKAAFSPKGLEGLDPEGTYSVTDARFPNEYQWLENRFMLDFKGFYVNRPEAETILSQATHMSELAVKDVRALMKPEQILDNSGPLESLREQLLRKAL